MSVVAAFGVASVVIFPPPSSDPSVGHDALTVQFSRSRDRYASRWRSSKDEPCPFSLCLSDSPPSRVLCDQLQVLGSFSLRCSSLLQLPDARKPPPDQRPYPARRRTHRRWQNLWELLPENRSSRCMPQVLQMADCCPWRIPAEPACLCRRPYPGKMFRRVQRH